jgi:hypothetical protein
MVRAMKSLMRMSCASVLQPRRLYNGVPASLLTPGFSPVYIVAVATAFSLRLLREGVETPGLGFGVSSGLKAGVD